MVGFVGQWRVTSLPSVAVTEASEMTEGWYDDPAPPNPAFPTTMRYWDGRQWTGRTRPASRAERAARRAAEAQWAAEQMELGIQVHGATPAIGSYLPVTPDGQLLSGWWRRYGAVLIDGLILQVAVIAFSWRFLRQIYDTVYQYAQLAAAAQQNGSIPPPTDELASQLGSSYQGVVVVSVLVGLAYNVGFLKAFSATPGKMLLGIEVRLRERPGPLPWGTILLRYLTTRLWIVLAFAGLLGWLLSFAFYLLDNLWPVWDGHRQALHDKVARTNVVRR